MLEHEEGIFGPLPKEGLASVPALKLQNSLRQLRLGKCQPGACRGLASSNVWTTGQRGPWTFTATR
jgi:hypothetical protein